MGMWYVRAGEIAREYEQQAHISVIGDEKVIQVMVKMAVRVESFEEFATKLYDLLKLAVERKVTE